MRRTIELTELGLALRRSVVQQGSLVGDAMTQVMREIRRAKEQAWQPGVGPRSLSGIDVRYEVKKAQADARPQAPKNRKRIRWIR